MNNESKTLAQHEADIERSASSFLTVGKALLAIKKGNLYPKEYGTIEGYFEQRWNFSKSAGYDYINAATVSDLVGTSLLAVKPTFSHFVALFRLYGEAKNEARLNKFIKEQYQSTMSVKALCERIEEFLNPDGKIASSNGDKLPQVAKLKDMANLIAKKSASDIKRKDRAEYIKALADVEKASKALHDSLEAAQREEDELVKGATESTEKLKQLGLSSLLRKAAKPAETQAA